MEHIPNLRLKKNEERRLSAGHLWIFSNEIDIQATPLKTFEPGQEVLVIASNQAPLGVAYVNPHSLIAARVFSRDPRARLSLDFFIQKLRSALHMRDSIFEKPFYRMVFGESDGLPGLIVDRYAEHLVVQTNTAGMDLKKDRIVEALLAVLPETQSILFRNDSGARLQEGLTEEVLIGFGEPPQSILIQENDASFHASPWTGQKTAWFYDHRMNRARLKTYAKDKRVLDVFSYLGGWGIQAALAGAREVVCLDASQKAVDTIHENAELNQISQHIHTICDDAFIGLKKLIDNQEKFDLIILDPPAFVKKLKDKKDGQIAYQRINAAALKLLNPEGLLFSCSCSMHMSDEDLLQALRRASISTKLDIQILERGHQGPDHPVHPAIPETNYLKMILAKRM